MNLLQYTIRKLKKKKFYKSLNHKICNKIKTIRTNHIKFVRKTTFSTQFQEEHPKHLKFFFGINGAPVRGWYYPITSVACVDGTQRRPARATPIDHEDVERGARRVQPTEMVFEKFCGRVAKLKLVLESYGQGWVSRIRDVLYAVLQTNRTLLMDHEMCVEFKITKVKKTC